MVSQDHTFSGPEGLKKEISRATRWTIGYHRRIASDVRTSKAMMGVVLSQFMYHVKQVDPEARFEFNVTPEVDGRFTFTVLVRRGFLRKARAVLQQEPFAGGSWRHFENWVMVHTPVFVVRTKQKV